MADKFPVKVRIDGEIWRFTPEAAKRTVDRGRGAADYVSLIDEMRVAWWLMREALGVLGQRVHNA